MYSNNVAYSRFVNKKQIEKAIDYCGEHEYYSLVLNNCAQVAVRAWNESFDTKEFVANLTPLLLFDEIFYTKDYFVFDDVF